MDPDHSDAASLARELLPRLRRWDSASWSVAAELPAEPPPAAASGGAAGGAARPAGRPGPRPDPRLGPVESTGAPRRSRRGRRRGGSVPTRADVAAATVQRLADAGADAEGQPRRPVPLLAGVNPADQLTVMVEDILRAGDPAALRTAATELALLRAALGYR